MNSNFDARHLPAGRSHAQILTLAMFSAPALGFWFLLFGVTLASELISPSLVLQTKPSVLVHDSYAGLKLLTSFLFSFMTPVAWGYCKTLGRGALFAVVIAALVEVGRGLTHGHRSGVLELAVRLVVLFAGFACGLEARKYRQLAAGPLSVRFSSRYLPTPFSQSPELSTANVRLGPPDQERIAIGQAFVDRCSFDEAVAYITAHALAASGVPAYVVTPNAQHIVMLAREPRLREIYHEASLVVADGFSLLLAARALGRKFPERVAGVDLFQALCSSAAQSGLRVFLLGGQPGSADLAASVMEKRFPALHVETYCPPLGFENTEAELERIRQVVTLSRPDLLFVALGAPKQEYWIYDHGRKLGASVCIGVGGSFEMVSGIVPRAPRWVQNTGFEWVYRLCLEPRRMWRRYLVGNLQFVWIVLRQMAALGLHRVPEIKSATSGGDSAASL